MFLINHNACIDDVLRWNEGGRESRNGIVLSVDHINYIMISPHAKSRECSDPNIEKIVMESGRLRKS